MNSFTALIGVFIGATIVLAVKEIIAQNNKEYHDNFLSSFYTQLSKEYKKNPYVIKMHLHRKRFSKEPLSEADLSLKALDDEIDRVKSTD